MATAISSFAEFNPSEEEWVSYSERFHFYLLANGIENPSLKLATLLSTIGASTYKLIRILCSPTQPVEIKLTKM